MKKCDLRSGMIVVNRSGKKGIVLLGTSRGNVIGGFGHSVSCDLTTWHPLDTFNDDLTPNKSLSDSSDIMRVYNPTSNKHFGSSLIEDAELIWERLEPLVLTIDDIAAKFGVEPSSIRIKKD
jgi:hypothetical protein